MNKGQPSVKTLNVKVIMSIMVCLFINMIDGFDITLMAVTAHNIALELDIPMDELGLVFSSALAGMVCGAMSLSILSDVIGRRIVVLVSLSVLGISVLFTSVIDNFSELIALRFISGIAGGALLACQATLVSEYSSDKYKALAVCIVTAGYPLGAMFTGIVAQDIIELYNWRMMFIIGGISSFLLVVVAYFFLPEPESKNLESHLLNKPYPLEIKETVSTGKWRIKTVEQLLSKENKGVTISFWIVFFLCFSTMYFLMSWMPKLLDNAGYAPVVGQQAFSLFNLGGVIGTILLGLMAIEKNLNKLVRAFFITAFTFMILFSLFAETPSSINLIVFLLGLFFQGGFVGLYALTSLSYTRNIRATGLGWAIGLGRLGAVLGPALAGVLVAGGVSLSTSFLIFSLPVLIAVMLLMKKETGLTEV